MTATVDQDIELVRRARAGDYAAFTSLVDKYERRIYGLVLRMLRQQQDAEDVTQQTYISAIEHLKDFRGESTFFTWLTRIATNHALKLLRKRKGSPTVPLEAEDGHGNGPESYGEMPHPDYIAPWREEPDALAQRQDTRRLLDAALNTLGEKYRVVFILRDMNEVSTAETARILGISENNVKIRLLRARLQLREVLTRRLGDAHARLLVDHHH